MEDHRTPKHFVLVHGACHGAWCWYKLKPRLEAAGHRVTAIDMAASGINPKKYHEIYSLSEYCEPLMESMASVTENDKVILVGHSYGGVCIAAAMDAFPEKIVVAVFMTAYMPDTVHRPSYVLEKYFERRSEDKAMDNQIMPYGNPQQSHTALLAGPNFMRSTLYPLCSDEDYSLATMLVRPTSIFIEDMKTLENYINEGYGSVRRVFIVVVEDKGMPLEFQRWMIQNNPPTEVKEIKGADHMLMLSMPDQTCQYLLEIAHKYV